MTPECDSEMRLGVQPPIHTCFLRQNTRTMNGFDCLETLISHNPSHFPKPGKGSDRSRGTRTLSLGLTPKHGYPKFIRSALQLLSVLPESEHQQFSLDPSKGTKMMCKGKGGTFSGQIRSQMSFLNIWSLLYLIRPLTIS